MLILPATLALGLLSSGRQSVASAPIPLAWRDGFLCVPIALMGGKPSYFVLDTGSYRSFLTQRAYTRLQEAGARVGDDGTLTVKGVTIGDYAVPSLDFGHETDAFQFTVDPAADGYLGMDFLSKFRVGIDLRDKTLRLWPASTPIDTVTKEWLSADKKSFWSTPVASRAEGFCVPVDVGNLTVPMVLDTGCPETFLHANVAALLQDSKRRGLSTVLFYNGLHKARSYWVPSAGIGGVPLGERTVNVAGGMQMVGLLGRDLISSLRVLIDYPGARAYFMKQRPEVVVKEAPVYDGPTVTLLNGVVVHWPRGVVAHVPPLCSYSFPPGYKEVFKADDTVDLVPTKVGGAK